MDGAVGPAGAAGPAGADGIGTYNTFTGTPTADATGVITVTESCADSQDIAVFGGFTYSGSKGSLLATYQDPSDDSSWILTYDRSGGGGVITLIVICADVTP